MQAPTSRQRVAVAVQRRGAPPGEPHVEAPRRDDEASGSSLRDERRPWPSASNCV
jgi:hypothetical protein